MSRARLMREGKVPAPVARLIDDWQSAERPPQKAFSWHRERWLTKFPECKSTLEALPDLVDRQAVRDACSAAAAAPEAAVAAFAAAMVWGYGWSVGYGPWRTRRILDTTSDAPSRLAHLAQGLATVGHLA